MSKEREMIKGLRGLLTPGTMLSEGIVKSIEGDTCTVDIAGMEYKEIQMRASITSEAQKILLVPKVGTAVIVVTFPLTGDSVIVARDAVERIEVSGDITINGGQNGGMVKVEELKKNLNSLKTYCETLKSAIATGLNGVGASTAASGAAGAAAFNNAMTGASITIDDMENKRIKQ